MLNTAELNKEFHKVLEEQDGNLAMLFIERWIPEALSEIQTQRNRINLLEAQISEIQDENDYLKGPAR